MIEELPPFQEYSQTVLSFAKHKGLPVVCVRIKGTVKERLYKHLPDKMKHLFPESLLQRKHLWVFHA